MSCSNRSQGICDNSSVITILTTRIFDNVRLDLDRNQLNFSSSVSAENITPLYFSGTGKYVQQSGLTVTPNYNNFTADICGNLLLPGTFTYLEGGTRKTADANLIIPICVRMNIPSDSIWPFNITINYSYYADNISSVESGVYSAITDGVIIIYVTSDVPVCVPYSGVITYNSLSSRTVQIQNNFSGIDFYPAAQSSAPAFEVNSCTSQ